MTSLNQVRIVFILSKGERNSYQLSKMLSTLDRRMSSGTLFPILRDLQNDGLIAMREYNGKKLYSLTEKGKRYVDSLEKLRDNLRKKIMESYLRDHIVMYDEKDYPLLLSRNFVDYISDLNDMIGDEVANLLSFLISRISSGDRDAILRIKKGIEKIMEDEYGIHR